jgi:ankyrin repeat protein
MWAANRGSVPIVQLLLERGADPNARDRVKSNEGRTPLMYAKPGSQGIVELLIAHGAKPEIRDRFKHNAADHALDQAEAFERFGDKREAAKWRKQAEQLQKYVR